MAATILGVYQQRANSWAGISNQTISLENTAGSTVSYQSGDLFIMHFTAVYGSIQYQYWWANENMPSWEWVTQASTGGGSPSESRLYCAIANSSTHNTGTWDVPSNSVMTIVGVRNFLQGYMALDAIGGAAATRHPYTYGPPYTAPGLSLTNSTGGSAVIHFLIPGTYSDYGWGEYYGTPNEPIIPSGYTLRNPSTKYKTSVVSKDVTTTAPALQFTLADFTYPDAADYYSSQWAAASIEIQPKLPTKIPFNSSTDVQTTTFAAAVPRAGASGGPDDFFAMFG